MSRWNLKISVIRHITLVTIIIMASLTQSLIAATTLFETTGSWDDAGNWDNGIPTAGDLAYLKVPVTATVDTTNCVGALLAIGESTGGVVNLVNGGKLYLSADLWCGYLGTGTVNQTGGEISMNHLKLGYSTAGESVGVYNQSGGTNTVRNFAYIPNLDSYGEYNLSGGTWDVRVLRCGYDAEGTGVVNQSGGLVTPGTHVDIGWNTYGEYNLSGGTLMMPDSRYLNIGSGLSYGRFVQTGGTNIQQHEIYIDTTISNSGMASYVLQSGAFIMSNAYRMVICDIGSNGKGVFYFGTNSSANGEFKEVGSSCDLYMAYGGTNNFAELHGFGAVELSSYFRMNGRTVADGYGVDKTFDFSTFIAVRNQYQNPVTGSNGWYAINHGKVLLKPYTQGSINVTWGEDLYYEGHGADLDLVNSAKIVFSDTVTLTNLTGELLAPDRTDVDVADMADIAGLWDFTGVTMGSRTAVLKFRYDHNAIAAGKYPSEGELQLFHFEGGEWVDVTGTVDTVNKWVTSTSVDTLGKFAVARDGAPKGTLITIK